MALHTPKAQRIIAAVVAFFALLMVFGWIPSGLSNEKPNKVSLVALLALGCLAGHMWCNGRRIRQVNFMDEVMRRSMETRDELERLRDQPG